jgi:hypothetical protein
MTTTPATTVRNLQVITFALMGGLVVLMTVIMTVLLQAKPEGFVGAKGPKLGEWPLLTVVLSGIASFNLLLALTLPGFISRTNLNGLFRTVEPLPLPANDWETADASWQERIPAETMKKLLGIYQSEKIMGAALAEAGGMLSAMAYLMEAQWVSVVLLFLCIVVMLWRLPTLSSWNTWLIGHAGRATTT